MCERGIIWCGVHEPLLTGKWTRVDMDYSKTNALFALVAVILSPSAGISFNIQIIKNKTVNLSTYTAVNESIILFYQRLRCKKREGIWALPVSFKSFFYF